jgi:hypothetical protein
MKPWLMNLRGAFRDNVAFIGDLLEVHLASIGELDARNQELELRLGIERRHCVQL